MNDEATDIEQTWAFMGRRLVRNKYVYLWLDEEGEQRVYDKLKASAPGHLYVVKLAPDGKVFLGARYTGEQHPDEALRRKWAAADREAAVEHNAAAAERKARDDLAPHLEALREAYSSERIFARRAALLAAFIEEITR